MTSRHENLNDLPLVLHNVPWGLRTALAQEGVPCVDFKRGGASGRLVLFDGRAGAPALTEGQHAIDIRAIEEFAALNKAMESEESAEGRYEIRGWTLLERVARFDRRAARKALMALLAEKVHAVGGTWARVAAFPFPYRSAFNLRFDYDEHAPHDVRAVHEAIRDYEHATSHFLCAQSIAGDADLAARLRDFHVGSHGYFHHTYRDAEENAANITRGVQELLQAGLAPVGFVAPHGRYPRGMGAVLSQLEIAFSSEFSLARDDLPFTPRGSRVLQIPCHPVCLGLFLEAQQRLEPARPVEDAVEAATRHLCDYAISQAKSGEPIFVYGHPDGRLGRYPRMIIELLQTVESLPDIWQTTLTEFALWWKSRNRLKVRATRDGECLHVHMDSAHPAHGVAIEIFRDGKWARHPIAIGATTLKLDRLSFASIPDPVRIAPEFDALRRTARSVAKEWLDWERVTPVCELPRRTPRGLIKRALRRALPAKGGRAA